MRILKITGLILTGLIVLVLGYVGYLYYYHFGRFSIDQEKYPHRIGYIDRTESISPKGFTLCSEDIQIGFYSSAAPNAYKGSKYAFRKLILENYENRGYTDSGFLNLRFHVNCKGTVGHVVINEVGMDYKKTELNDDMVNQLVNLAIKEENWNAIIKSEKRRDIYMYLIFKIENGEVLEILP